MAYTVEPKGHPQSHRPPRVLTAISGRVLDRLTELNREIADSLSVELLTNAQDCDLVHILNSAVSERRTSRRPVTWEISIFAGTLKTRAYLYRLAKTQGQLCAVVDQPSLRPVETCLVCHGAGYVPPMDQGHPRRIIAASLAGESDPKAIMPGSILKSSRYIAGKLDELRGRGIFDRVVQCMERRLLVLRQPIFHFRIDIQSRIHVARMHPIVAPLGFIRLSPHFAIDGEEKTFSSRWEAAKITGRKPPCRLTYFHACAGCLGIGIKKVIE